jgi:aspartate/methionine/tyrosine aminotransferase
MQFPERFSDLPEYAFPRLRKLLADVIPGGPELAMTIGEPRHPLPAFVGAIIAGHAAEFGRYPPNEGMPDLLEAIAAWLAARYGVTIPPDTGLIALNGSREGLFNAALALSPETRAGRRPAVLMPNPFYQCYGAAALAVGAEPVAVPATAETGFFPDYAALPADTLDRVTLAYLCSPANPQGAVADATWWRDLLALAEHHDFRVLADECYSEIYRDDPPPGALQAAAASGADPERVLAFNSLSKRSSAPGLRSGFAAGGPRSIAAMRRLRASSGAPLPLPLQRAAAALWRDEAHVRENRRLYREKYAVADRILGDLPGYAPPAAGFFLWLAVGDGEAAAVGIYRRTGVRVLPGGYLARPGPDGTNPGARHIRIALIADAPEVERGLTAIRDTVYRSSPQERVD